VVHPTVSDLTETIDLNATTVFLSKETVRATFQGFIEKAFKQVGDDVKAGEPLFLMRTKEASANDSLGIKLGNAAFGGSVSIPAKTDGVLTEVNFHVGDFVNEGESIATVSNPSSLRIALDAPFQYASILKRGETVKLFLPDGTVMNASIQRAIPSVDPGSQTQKYLLRTQDGAMLPENLNLNVRLPVRTARRVLALPPSAVLCDETQETFWVMKLVNDSTAVRIDVQKGVENDSLVQIINPILDPIDRVVSEGGYGLPDTAVVFISVN
jgi:multidrug efflux pump subunit AcrA (membrane-fusion protein)